MKTTQLEQWMPHRAPMIWIDEVLDASASGGRCQTLLQSEGRYLTNGILRASSLIELMAQAFGYISAAHAQQQTTAPETQIEKAFLVALKDAKFEPTADIQIGETLVTRIQNVRSMGPIVMFDGSVTCKDQVLASAHLRVFAQHKQKEN